jgi:hypothetical protein
MAAVAWLSLFGLESAEERRLKEALSGFLASGRAEVSASQVLPSAWQRICILPSYTTAEELEPQLGRKFSFADNVRWQLYWGSDDRYFGFAIVHDDESVLPLKLWKANTPIDTNEWPAHCVAREHAFIRRDDQLVSLSKK